MSQFDQHTTMIALEKALVPNPRLVDGRTEADNLRLLADFASLFNFYDRTNTINGNWSPFLLKDPVFLVASIAKTSFQKAYSLFINTCLQLEKKLEIDINTAFISNGFNQLFDQLTYIFQIIERWTYYMQQSNLEYNLKTYVIQQVKQKQSALLWALLSLQSNLHINQIIPNIKPVNTYLFQDYDEKIWKESKGKTPYWELLNLKYTPKGDYVYFFFKDFITYVEDIIATLNGSHLNLTEKIITKIIAAFIALQKSVAILFEETVAILEKVVAFVENAIESLFEIIEKIIQELHTKIKTFKGDEEKTAVIQQLLTDLNSLQNTLKTNTSNLATEDFKNLIDRILKEIETILLKVAAFVVKYGEWMFTIIIGIFETAISIDTKISKILYDILKDIIAYILTKQVRSDIFNGIKGTGKTIFSFYSKCISYAATELKNIQQVPGHFPDTMLLRTFTSLLKIYQAQLNSLSEKHLHFYYNDILKQTPNSVSPDTVFASSSLAKKTATYQLAKGTIFTAGLDANKAPILFETLSKTSLNPAKIVNAYILSLVSVDAYNPELYLQKLPPVNVVAKDEAGAIKSWKTFGSTQTPQGTKQELAFTIASPMFYLTEATLRTITLNFTFANCDEITFIQPAFKFYLSTKDTWFEVPAPNNASDVITENQIELILQPTDPVISAFTKNPDGYSSEWPLLKIVFPDYTESISSLQIATLDIIVNVEELQNFQLYNDFGQLNAKKPFQLLGGAPKVNQSFMIGNAEIFSKPVQNMQFFLTWNQFAPGFNFADYYIAYNNYLNNVYSGTPIDVNELVELLDTIKSSQDTFFTKATNSAQTLFTKLAAASTTPADAEKEIQGNQTDLQSLVSTQKTALQKMPNSLSAIMTQIINLNKGMQTAIDTFLTTFKNDISSAGKIDETTVTTTKNSINNEISSSKTRSDQNIEDEQNALLSTVAPEKKSFLNTITGFFKKQENSIVAKTYTPYFSDTSFIINFQALQNGVWNSIDPSLTTENTEGKTIIDNVDSVSLFDIDSVNLEPTKEIQFLGLTPNPATIDPTLQQKLLQLTETTTTGFIKMKLSDPAYGFGTELYAKVVAAIALFNAQIIAEKIKDSDDKQELVSPPNIPFVPMVSAFTGNYSASVSYDFSTNEQSYPLQCFYNTPFANYKVYDTTLDEKIIAENTTIGSPPARNSDGKITQLTALPLLPTFNSQGQLFLELQDVIAPAKVSFYFELARAYTETTLTTKQINYSYLSSDGWKKLTSIADDTNNFTCSGIITINIPSDITTVHNTVEGTNYWIAIGTNNTLDSFPETSFLKTNGFALQRIVTATDFSTQTPQILADIITSPQTAIPAIAATVQPFASFGGKAAETTIQMNSRVSTRIKTKDRLETTEDYFNTIRLAFPEVYYSKTVYDNSKNKAFTHVIKRVADVTETNAFQPLLSECTELEIQNYIAKRVSPFVTVSVENFTLNYVQITAEINVQPGEDITTVEKEVNNGINIYLAPWITSAQTQITVDSGLNTAQLASFINSYDSILEVQSISFLIGTKNFDTGAITYSDKDKPKQEIAQKDGILLVPSLNNTTKNSLITYN
ncbi:MAG: hypothetical protein AB8B65_07075 [Kordia sp.]|uniref:hypothetical protein n=1 Tax=Kordia sp. TaxID=1965332 RepID=UPI00385AFC6C